jgi:pyridoxamine 5'-phosphate oxidase
MNNTVFDKYGNDPLALFAQWLAEARQSEPNDPEAFCLATADVDGNPSARMLLLKEADARGFKFHTNAESRKGTELAKNPHAEMCFYWKSTRKQVRVHGTVETVSEAEADAYFSTRSRARQIGAWASQQSQELEDELTLQRAVEKYEAEFADKPVPRPPHWQGYRLKPESIEFWIGQEHRLHTRFIYTKEAGTDWAATWLNP